MIRLDAALPREEAIGGSSAAAVLTFFASSAALTAFNRVFNSERIARLRSVLAALCRMRLAVDGRFTLPLLAVAPGGGPARGATFYHSARRRVKGNHADRRLPPSLPPTEWSPDPSHGSAQGERRLLVHGVACVEAP
jgi:hypothetical protein